MQDGKKPMKVAHKMANLKWHAAWCFCPTVNLAFFFFIKGNVQLLIIWYWRGILSQSNYKHVLLTCDSTIVVTKILKMVMLCFYFYSMLMFYIMMDEYLVSNEDNLSLILRDVALQAVFLCWALPREWSCRWPERVCYWPSSRCWHMLLTLVLVCEKVSVLVGMQLWTHYICRSWTCCLGALNSSCLQCTL